MPRLVIVLGVAVALSAACGPAAPASDVTPVTARYRGRMEIDRYAPSDDPAPVVVLLVHGCCGDRRDMAALARALARRGATVVNPDIHALGRGGGWPASYIDVVCAYAWAQRLNSARGVPVAIVAWGDGALVGASVALGWPRISQMATDCAARPSAAGPRNVIALSGHFGWTGEPPTEMVVPETIKWFGGTPGAAPQAWHQGNPGWWLDHGGRRDVSFDLLGLDADAATEGFAVDLRAHGRSATLSILGSGDHGELVQPRGVLGQAALGVLACRLRLDASDALPACRSTLSTTGRLPR